MLQAFMPETAKRILDRLKITGYEKIATDSDFVSRWSRWEP
jgi:hypothetical protein